jgi:imidazolonepropionase-like amidohydrolase
MRLVLIPVVLSLGAAVVAVPVAGRGQPPAPAAKTTLYTNATIHTGTGDKPIVGGYLVVKDGKIAAVSGPGVALPDLKEEATVVDLKGAVIIPGLVDTHSHIGVWSRPGVSANADLSETSGPVQPGVRALDAINPDDPGIRMATAGGITTANIMPGSANVIGGETLYVKLRGGSVEEMRINGRLANGTEVFGGLKMANGENPKGYGKNKQQAPFTRMKVAALQRETFQKAREYKAKLDAGQKVDRDITLEAIVEVLEKKRTVHFHCHRADDLMTAVRISEEFGFEIVLQHATEGYRVADILAKKKIPVSLTLIDSPGGKAETIGLLEENAAALDKAGVQVAINTDDSITESRFFLHTGAIAVRGGMPEAAALKAMTLTPAKLMHLDHRIGSLERGKDADFVVLSGPPFSTYTRVKQTFIEGKKVFDETADRAYRDGGFMLPAGEKVLSVKPRPDRGEGPAGVLRQGSQSSRPSG